MRARVVESQADIFEVAVLSQTADLQAVSTEELLASPSGPPVVLVGSLLVADRLNELRTLASILARARTTVIVVPPFTDLDLGRYFETPVRLRAQRRPPESSARTVEGGTQSVMGEEVKVRSDHFFDTALGAGVLAVDPKGKAVLIRYQASNMSGPVFFSALQLLTYTSLTDEGQRQDLLAHLLSWTPQVTNERGPSPESPSVPTRPGVAAEGVMVQVALLLAAAGLQTKDQLRARADVLLGADLSTDDIGTALEELGRRGVIDASQLTRTPPDALRRFLEERGMHAYVRELEDLLAAEESRP